MNRNKLVVILTILWSMISVMANAYDFEVDGIYYNIVSISDLTCEIVPKRLELNYQYSDYSGDFVIPSNVQYQGKTLKVVKIGNYAFYKCSVTSVTIPNSVTHIGSAAFNGCEKLTSIPIPSTVKYIYSNSFAGCTSLKKIILPNGISTIYYGTFSGCSSLTEVPIPSNVTIIEGKAFSDCSSLNTINLPDKLEKIGAAAFSGCSRLKSVKIPDSVKEIENAKIVFYTNSWHHGNCKYDNKGAFEDCIRLESIQLGNGLEYIGNRAFAGCSSLKSISIPASVEYVGYDAFTNSTINDLTIMPSDNPLVLYYSNIKEDSSINSVNIYDLFYDNPINKLYLGRKIKRFYYEPEIYNAYILKKGNSMDWYGHLQNKENELFGNKLTSLAFGNNLTSDDYGLIQKKLKHITFGKGFSTIPNLEYYDTNLDSLVIINDTPPGAGGFSNKTYINCRLYVPKGCKTAYETAEVWKNFWNVFELEQDINTLGVNMQDNYNQQKEVSRFTIDGIKLNNPHKGINIIKMNDGTVKKVMVK